MIIDCINQVPKPYKTERAINLLKLINRLDSYLKRPQEGLIADWMRWKPLFIVVSIWQLTDTYDKQNCLVDERQLMWYLKDTGCHYLQHKK